MKKLALSLGLSEGEYKRIKKLLGRTPTKTEIYVFSAMWSEHCSYKNSWKHIRTLSSKGSGIFSELGTENVGAVRPDKETLWVFKMESHNHPSAVHPFYGAATGVGGILRDVFTTGAYPVAIMNSLKFGEPEHNISLIKGIIEGIAFYGNSFGVPNVGGEMFFHNSYEKNPLVNVLAFGVVKEADFISAKAEGVGNAVFIVGNTTGKDGLHGAAFASENLEETNPEAIQIPDPLLGKSLLEAIIEAKQYIVAMQDMGAAGIISSTSEMSFKGKLGMKIYLNKVPVRTAMAPYEILLSESQERMLIITKQEDKQKLKKIFKKYNLIAEEIGEIISEKKLIFYWNSEIIAQLSPELLARGGKAPEYSRTSRTPKYFLKQKNYDGKIKEQNFLEAMRFLLRFPSIAGKTPLTVQYDNRVGLRHISASIPTTASLIFDEVSGKIAALTTDCNPLKVYKNPYEGTIAAVCEGVMNLLCAGAEPLGITDCLNFGNPYNEDIFWLFENSVKGLKKASEELQIPVVSGNVSFYNQTKKKAILPTPTLGIVGVIKSKEDILTKSFKKSGDLIYLIGDFENNTLNASIYLYYYKQIADSVGVKVNLETTRKLLRHFKELPVNAANDISEGGLFIALSEMLMPGRNVGVFLENRTDLSDETFLFGEGANILVTTISPKKKTLWENKLKDIELPFVCIGEVIPEECFCFRNIKVAKQEIRDNYFKTFKDLRFNIYERKCDVYQ